MVLDKAIGFSAHDNRVNPAEQGLEMGVRAVALHFVQLTHRHALQQ